MAFILGYLSLFAMGIILGLLGGGGAILTLPILVYAFHVPPVLGTSYSLFVVGVSALMGTFAYLRRGELDFRKSVLFFIPSALGVIISRRLILPTLPEIIIQSETFTLSRASFLMFVFSALMLFVGSAMLKPNNEKKTSFQPSRQIFKQGSQALGVGLLTGFVGAGGGFLIVPALLRFFALPMKTAIGSSLLVIALNSGVGFASDLAASNAIVWRDLLLYSGTGLLGMFFGSALGKRLSAAQLRSGFAYFVLLVGLLIAIFQTRDCIS